MNDSNVLIVGAGPVGLTLAIDRTWRGIDVRFELSAELPRSKRRRALDQFGSDGIRTGFGMFCSREPAPVRAKTPSNQASFAAIDSIKDTS
jgi:thioredoxin reductase